MLNSDTSLNINRCMNLRLTRDESTSEAKTVSLPRK